MKFKIDLSMKKPLLILLVLLSCCFALAEKQDAEHMIFFEIAYSGETILQPSGMPKIEYHFNLHRNQKHAYYLTAGMGMQLFSLHFPLGFTYAYGTDNIIILGLHYNINIGSPGYVGQLGNSISAQIGYRRQTDFIEDGSYVQLYFSPYFNLVSKELHPGIGIGVGLPL